MNPHKGDEGKTTSPARIGVFGGTFDPVHVGHLRSAEEIRQLFFLPRIEFVPAKIPPHKTGQPTTDISHRIAMLEMAVARNPFFKVSRAEACRGGISYLVDTLKEYRDRVSGDGEICFIMGMDSFRELSTWRCYPDLFSLSHFVVISRPGYTRPPLHEAVSREVASAFQECAGEDACLQHTSGQKIYFKETTLLDISSRAVRACIRQGESVRYLIPEDVEVYIQQNGLYTKPKGNA